MNALPGEPRSNGWQSAIIASLLMMVIFGVSPNRVRADILYASEFYQGNIVTINTANGVVNNFASGLSYPEGMAMDKSGNLYVSTLTAGVIYKISPSGNVTTFVSNLSSYVLNGLAIDASGNLYVGANPYTGPFYSAILKFNPSGSLLSTWGWSDNGPVQPTGLAFDPSGNGTLWVTDYSGNGLYTISSTGNATKVTQILVNPLGLAFNSQGQLFVATRSSGAIDEVSPAGTYSTFVSGVDNPCGLVFDSSGNLYTADSPNGGTGTTITQITSSGATSIFATGLNEPLFLLDGTTAVPEPGVLGLSCLGFLFLRKWKISRR